MLSIMLLHIVSLTLAFNTELKTEKLEIISKRNEIAKIVAKSDLGIEILVIIAIILQVTDLEIFFYPSRIAYLIPLQHNALKILKKIEDRYAVSN